VVGRYSKEGEKLNLEILRRGKGGSMEDGERECFHFCVSNRFPLVYCFCFDQPAAGGLAPDTTDQALGPKASSATRLSDLSSSFGCNAGFLPFEFSLVRRSGALRRGFCGAGWAQRSRTRENSPASSISRANSLSGPKARLSRRPGLRRFDSLAP
jgi:hypothetical protein